MLVEREAHGVDASILPRRGLRIGEIYSLSANETGLLVNNDVMMVQTPSTHRWDFFGGGSDWDAAVKKKVLPPVGCGTGI